MGGQQAHTRSASPGPAAARRGGIARGAGPTAVPGRADARQHRDPRAARVPRPSGGRLRRYACPPGYPTLKLTGTSPIRPSRSTKASACMSFAHARGDACRGRAARPRVATSIARHSGAAHARQAIRATAGTPKQRPEPVSCGPSSLPVSGHKQPRRRGRDAPARTKWGLAPRVASHLLFGRQSRVSPRAGAPTGMTADAIHLVSADSRAAEPLPCLVRSAGKRVPALQCAASRAGSLLRMRGAGAIVPSALPAAQSETVVSAGRMPVRQRRQGSAWGRGQPCPTRGPRMVMRGSCSTCTFCLRRHALLSSSPDSARLALRLVRDAMRAQSSVLAAVRVLGSRAGCG